MTLPVATLLGTAWIIVSGVKGDAPFLFFMGGFIFTFLLRYTEQEIFESNRRKGY